MKYLNIIFFLLFSQTIFAQSHRILLDGHFSDWQGVSIAHTDTNGDDGWSNIDFQNLWVTNDEEYLFVRFETTAEINLQNDNNIVLYLDTDNNSNTGISFNGIGAEFSYAFGEREGLARFGDTNYFLDHEDVDLVTGPTVTGTQFEVAIRRSAQVSGNAFFPENTIQVALQDDISNGDQLPNQSGGVNYTFGNDPLDDLPPYSIAQVGDESFRAISYNVLQDGLFEPAKQDAFTRILQALDPDIIGFQEIYNHNSTLIKNVVEEMLPSDPGEQWYHSKINPDIAIVSRFPIDQAFIIGGVGGGANGAFLLNLPDPFNTDLLFINAHTPCCDNDFERQFEIDAMMAFLRDAKDGIGPMPIEEGTPVIITGDMNLVGSKESLETLITGNIINQNTFGHSFTPDWDGSDLEDLIPFATNTPMAFTWHDDFSSFSPGRLDAMIYSGSVLEKKNGFTLFTAELPNADLAAHNLNEDDTGWASDHLPLVADFELTEVMSVDEFSENDKAINLQIFPNPVANDLYVEYYLPEGLEVNFSILNVLGKSVRKFSEGYKGKGKHFLNSRNLNLPNGTYWLQLTTNNENHFSQFIINH